MTIECVVLSLFGKEHKKLENLNAETLSRTIARLKDRAGVLDDSEMLELTANVSQSTTCQAKNPLVEEYLASPILALPIEHPDNTKIIKISELEVTCKCCGGKTSNVRGKPEFHSECIDLRAAGVCKKCKMVTWTRTRVYSTHMLAWKDSGIEELLIGKQAYEVHGKLFRVFTRWIGYALLVMAGNTLVHGLDSATFVFVCACGYLANLLIGMSYRK